MDLNKIYHDSENKPCNIYQMVTREPEWAANMIQEGERRLEQAKWISTKDQIPDRKEPVIYCQRSRDGKRWRVGIAYWTVSQIWNPQMNSVQNPDGFTHWLPLPSDPPKEAKP